MNHIGSFLEHRDRTEMKRLKAAIAICLVCTLGRMGAAGDGVWNLPGGGSWNQAANWSGSLPNAPGDVALVGSLPSSNSTVTVNAPITLGELRSSRPVEITISGADPVNSTLTFDAGATDSTTIAVLGESGRLRIEAIVRTDPDAPLLVDTVGELSSIHLNRAILGDGDLEKVGLGALQLNGANNAWSGTLQVRKGVVEANHSFALGDLQHGTVVNGGTLRVLQAVSENVDLIDGALIAAGPMAGQTRVFGGQVFLNHAGPHTGAIPARQAAYQSGTPILRRSGLTGNTAAQEKCPSTWDQKEGPPGCYNRSTEKESNADN